MSGRTMTLDVEPARLDDASLKQLFLDARTHNRWHDRPVDDALLRELYDVAKLAPTSANAQPMRLVFVKSREWKSNFLLNLGYGDVSGVFPRNPRLDFDDACRIV